jgi:hypothetical protein
VWITPATNAGSSPFSRLACRMVSS